MFTIIRMIFSWKTWLIIAILYFFFGAQIKSAIYSKLGVEPKATQEQTEQKSETSSSNPVSKSLTEKYKEVISQKIGAVKQQIFIFFNEVEESQNKDGNQKDSNK
jgi:uncharacterized membrane protein YraQ (UPF0718 family)